MFRILDRYIVREVLLPFSLSLLVLTFLLEIPTIMAQGEQLIAKGVDWVTVVRILATLLPSALGLTIPMSLLLGILIGFSRLSADREFVALQACGVSIFRMLRPIALLAAVSTAATAYVMIVLLPDQNQKFREITFNILASSAEGDVKPRVFFQGLGANRSLYVREVLASGGGWRDVFLADSSGNDTTAYFAARGRLNINRAKETVELILENGTRHTTYLDKPDDYVATSFTQELVAVDAQSVFPRTTVLKGDNEMTIAELRAKIAENARTGSSSALQLFTIQQKFAFPAACIVLALIGLALGVTNRTDGTLGGFVMGFAVVMIYYTLLWSSRAMAVGGKLPPTLAPWIPNIVFGAAGIVLVLWRAGFADHPIRFALPSFTRPQQSPGESRRPRQPGRRRVVPIVVRMPQFWVPRPRLLDLYVSRQYLRVFVLALVGLLGVFYISTFIDMADRVFRGTASTGLLLQYLYFETPRYAYLIIPMAALVAALVVFGSLTKNSELIVMRACGVSLYRSAVPLLLFSLVLSGVLYEMQENVLAFSNRRADAILHVMRGFPAQTFGVLSRTWIAGQDGDIYHYEIFDPARNRFDRLTVFAPDQHSWRLASLTFAREVVLVSSPGLDADRGFTWQGRQGWTRTFKTVTRRNTSRNVVEYTPYAALKLPLEPPTYFKTDEPDAERMTYAQLNSYIEQLRTSGFHVVPYMVQLQRKVAFPFVTLIMTLLAVPFAITTGRRGALYGVGVGIVLAIVYWTMLSVFGAIGAGGVISPMLAAWAPNILFSAFAAYLILTVRT
jgi:LPS export ABC transporter permease LptG/LPS export ABC transporter permease LptF